jgi:acyl-CoA thioesterase FadM
MSKLFRIDIEIEFKHLDAQKFVNHSNIYTYIENAYINFFMKEVKTGWTFTNMPILLKESNTQFLKTINECSNLLAELEVLNVRNKGVEICVRIKDKKDPNVCYAIGKRVLIFCDLTTGLPRNFDEDLRMKLMQYINS